jgi:hypothetical protein
MDPGEMTSVEPELKNRLLIQKATLTKPINAGTSINGPTTPTNASPEFRPLKVIYSGSEGEGR